MQAAMATEEVVVITYPRPAQDEAYNGSYIVRWQEYKEGKFRATALLRNDKGTEHIPTNIKANCNEHDHDFKRMIAHVEKEIDKLAFGMQTVNGEWLKTNLDFNCVFGEEYIEADLFGNFRMEKFDDAAYLVLNKDGEGKKQFVKRNGDEASATYGSTISRKQLTELNLKFGRYELVPDLHASMANDVNEIWMKMVFHSAIHAKNEHIRLGFTAVTISVPRTALNTPAKPETTKKQMENKVITPAQFQATPAPAQQPQFTLQDAIALITKMGGTVTFNSIQQVEPVVQVPQDTAKQATTRINWAKATNYAQTLTKLAASPVNSNDVIVTPEGCTKEDMAKFVSTVRSYINNQFGSGVFMTRVVDNGLYVKRI